MFALKQTTADRLQLIMQERNLRQADVLEMIKPYCERYDVKIPRNALSQYTTGKVIPKQDKLTILGLALNVSEVWLMGYDVPREREKNAQNPVRDSKRENISRLFLALTEENQRKLLDYAQLLLTAQQAGHGSQD